MSSTRTAVRPAVRRKSLTVLTVAGMLASIIGFVPGAAPIARAGGGGGPATWYVAQSGSGSGTSGGSCGAPGFVGLMDVAIQAAVDAASSGDIVHLCEGTYDLATAVYIRPELTTFTFVGDGTSGSLTPTTVTTFTNTRLFSTGDYFYDGSDYVPYHHAISFSGMTMQGGNPTTIYGTGGPGGAVFVSGDVHLDRTEFIGNRADRDGGAVWARWGVTVAASSFTGNTTRRSGGAIFACQDAFNVYYDTIVACDGTTMTVVDSTFTDNTADSSLVPGGDSNGGGGAIYFRGTSSGVGSEVAVTGSHFAGNRAGPGYNDTYGGAIWADRADVTVRGGTFSDNSATLGYSAYAYGGAIYSHQDVRITGGTLFTGNVAEEYGGGAIYAEGTAESTGGIYVDNSAPGGGAIYGIGGLRSDHDTFTGNSAEYGGAVTSDVTISVRLSTFEGNSAESGGAIYIYCYNCDPLDLSGGTFTENSASGEGGAIYVYCDVYDDGECDSADFVGNTFADNTSGSSGGAIWANRVLTSRSDTFSRNSAVDDGGAIYGEGTVASTGGIYEDNTAGGGSGGAIWAEDITSRFDRFAGNIADQHGGAINANSSLDSSSGIYRANATLGNGGGAVWVSSALTSRDDLFVENTSGTDDGGAIYGDGGDELSVTNGTFSRNTAGDEGGAIYSNDAVTLTNSTFDANSAASAGAVYVEGQLTTRFVTFDANTATAYGIVDVFYLDATGTIFAGGDCDGTPGVDDDNLATDGSCPGTPATAAELDLQPLADNGGRTATIAITDGSVAYNAASSCDGLTEDQRGVERPKGGACDIGAYEAAPPPAIYIVGRTYDGVSEGAGAPESCSNTPYGASIQAAATAATNGDRIHICEGTYDLSSAGEPGPVTSGAKDLTFEGDGTASTIVDGGGDRRLFSAAGRTITLRDLTLQHGFADHTTGGAVRAARVVISAVVFYRNSATMGGGAIHATSAVESTNGTYLENTAGSWGGAILARDASGSGAAVFRSLGDTFRENVAVGLGSALGGGVYVNGGAAVTDGTFTENRAGLSGGGLVADVVRLERSTFARNTAPLGGAVSAYLSFSARNATFASNAADEDGGAIAAYGPTTTRFVTFADNTAGIRGGSLYVSSGDLDAAGTIFAGGGCFLDGGSRVGDLGNLATSPSCSSSTTTVAALGLRPLALNAPGTTETIAITDGSSAHDAVSLANCASVGTDQRGVARPQGPFCDAGAYELLPSVAYIVRTMPASDPCDQYGSIQAAVDEALASDVIHICDGTVTLTSSVHVDVDDLTFEGESTTGTIVDGDGAVRLFDASSVTSVTFRGLTLTGGMAPAGGTGGAVRAHDVTVVGARLIANQGDGGAGAIAAAGDIDSSDSLYQDNTSGAGGGGAMRAIGGIRSVGDHFLGNLTEGRGGAVYAKTGFESSSGTYERNASGKWGGAVYSDATASLLDDRFVRNEAGYAGGAVYGEYGIDSTGGTYEENRCEDGGGALYAYEGAIRTVGDTFRRNYADFDGGGAIYVETGSIESTAGIYEDNTSGSAGGALLANDGSVTSSFDRFLRNSADGVGGAVGAAVSVDSSAATYVDNTSGEHGGAVYSFVVRATESHFEGNSALGYGGAIAAMDDLSVAIELTASTFVGNTAGVGGGAIAVSTDQNVRVVLERTDFTSNTALAANGGAIAISENAAASTSRLIVRGGVFTGNFAAQRGGAIWAGGSSGGVTTLGVGRTLFLGNVSGGDADDDGGAVYGNGSIEIAASTFAYNDAGSGDGGAVWALGSVDATNATFVANLAESGAAIASEGAVGVTFVTFKSNLARDGSLLAGTALRATNSIFAGGDCVVGSTTTSGANFHTPPTVDACPGLEATLVELDFGTFGMNGGPTPTVELSAGSVAIDPPTSIGGQTSCTPAMDQRGVTRPRGDSCDAGAYEAPPPPTLLYNGPWWINSSTTIKNLSLSATIDPPTPGCVVRFDISGATWTTSGPTGGTWSATTSGIAGADGSVSAPLSNVPLGMYSVDLRITGGCAGRSSDSGTLGVMPGTVAKGTVGGGWYRLADAGGWRRSTFGQVVSVSSTYDRRTQLTTTTTKGQLNWFSNADNSTGGTGWRLKATISSVTTGGTSIWQPIPCPAGVGTTGSEPMCGRYSGTALLQQRNLAGVWVAATQYGSGGVVAFTVTVHDGGMLTTCRHHQCRTEDLVDYFGISIGGVPRPTAASDALPQTGSPVRLKRGSLRAF